jgi:hypothetical protein
VSEVVNADWEIDPAGLDRGKPDAGAEGVAGDRGAAAGGEEQVVVADAVGLDVVGDAVEPGLADAEGAGFVVLGVGLEQVALAGGGVLLGDRRRPTSPSSTPSSPPSGTWDAPVSSTTTRERLLRPPPPRTRQEASPAPTGGHGIPRVTRPRGLKPTPLTRKRIFASEAVSGEIRKPPLGVLIRILSADVRTQTPDPARIEWQRRTHGPG